jgi:transglutaminase-like putative cysteine protease
MNRFRVPRAKRIATCLLGADVLTQGATLTFALAPLRSVGGERTFFLLLVWVLLPHLIAALLRRGGWPRHRLASTAAALLLGAVTVGLGFVGWELLRTPANTGAPVFAGTAALALLAWFSALLLFIPPFYRVHDFLGGGVVLMGLLERRPDALILVPLFIVGVTVSAVCRHRLFDLRTGEVQGMPSTGRLAFSGIVAAGLASLIFSTLSGALFPLLDEDKLAEKAPPRSVLKGPDENQRRREDRSGGSTEASAREIGFPEVMRLAELSEARGNPTPVFHVKPPETGLDGSAPFPLKNRLWRIVAFERFDARRLQWSSFDRGFERRDWRPKGIRRPAELKRHPRQIDFEFSVETLVFRNLVLPYGWERLSPPEPREAASHYFTDGRSGIVPRRPQLAVGTQWICRFDPTWTPGLTLPPKTRGPKRADPDDLAIPSRDEIGYALEPLAEQIFGDARGIEEKVSKLRDFFHREIRYDLRLDWLPEDRAERFATFIGDARSGDCMYFATAAALLLRAARVPARFVAGYAGADWDADAGHWVIRQSHAHAWIEVATAGGRWLPLDPVTWTPGGTERGPLPAMAASRDEGKGWELRLFPDLVLLALALGLIFFGLLRSRGESALIASEGGQDLSDAGTSPSLNSGLFARRRRPGAKDPSAQLLWEYERFQGRLRRQRLHRRPHETLREHRRRLGAEHPALENALRVFEDLLDRGIYGERGLAAEDLERARQAAREARRARP